MRLEDEREHGDGKQDEQAGGAGEGGSWTNRTERRKRWGGSQRRGTRERPKRKRREKCGGSPPELSPWAEAVDDASAICPAATVAVEAATLALTVAGASEDEAASTSWGGETMVSRLKPSTDEAGLAAMAGREVREGRREEGEEKSEMRRGQFAPRPEVATGERKEGMD